MGQMRVTCSLITAGAHGAGRGEDHKIFTDIGNNLDASRDGKHSGCQEGAGTHLKEKKMTNLKNGFLAGFAATVVLSVLMVAKGMMGVMPELDVAAMLAAMIGAPIIVGWIGHFIIGTVAWGGGFAVLYDMIPGGNAVMKGIVFGIAAWLGMMIVVLPLAGAGFFGMSLGMMAPVMTLVLHIIFGAVLGKVYTALPATAQAV